MTETRFTWRWLLVVALVGIVMGLVFGLAAGWIVFPNVTSSNISGLSASAQNDYIVLVANTYAYDQDGARAKQRLAQLQDKDVLTRLERLAKSLGARKDPSAANVADLALVMGSEDSSLQVMSETLGNDDSLDPAQSEPTKSARGAEPEATERPTQDPDAAAVDDPAVEPTIKPKKLRQTSTPAPLAEATEELEVPATDVPQPTEPPQQAAQPQPTVPPTDVPAPAPAPVTTEFFPDYPGGWWDSVKFIPASVAPGQQYWKLKYARFCDWAPEDRFDSCEGFPGGGAGVGIWIMTVDESGNCVETPVTDTLNTGNDHPLTPDMLKPISFAWNPYGFSCALDYEKEMYGEGNTISVPGLPSDKITDLVMCSKRPPEGFNPPPLRTRPCALLFDLSAHHAVIDD